MTYNLRDRLGDKYDKRSFSWADPMALASAGIGTLTGAGMGAAAGIGAGMITNPNPLKIRDAMLGRAAARRAALGALIGGAVGGVTGYGVGHASRPVLSAVGSSFNTPENIDQYRGTAQIWGEGLKRGWEGSEYPKLATYQGAYPSWGYDKTASKVALGHMLAQKLRAFKAGGGEFARGLWSGAKVPFNFRPEAMGLNPRGTYFGNIAANMIVPGGGARGLEGLSRAGFLSGMTAVPVAAGAGLAGAGAGVRRLAGGGRRRQEIPAEETKISAAGSMYGTPYTGYREEAVNNYLDWVKKSASNYVNWTKHALGNVPANKSQSYNYFGGGDNQNTSPTTGQYGGGVFPVLGRAASGAGKTVARGLKSSAETVSDTATTNMNRMGTSGSVSGPGQPKFPMP